MKRPTPILLLTLITGLLMSPSLMAKGPPPDGRTYIVFVMGLGDDPLSPEGDCLTFDATRACTLDNGTCLDWRRTEGGLQTPNESGFSLATEIEDDGLTIVMEGQGRIDSRGPKSSISAAVHATALDVQLNFAFTGRQTSRNKCRRRIEDFQERMNTP